ncbi:hypothetical protein ARMGADRAFT_1013606 [Armillaria gallica]|uniref:Uncharacterized protein n=1 Tax=Armillaria gallica TaxID=47427 RepID=A0A2H3DDD8_ARMGA|nr:hypothetical protein ARMGADRAFT_1013606 [Armillaria gallica]
MRLNDRFVPRTKPTLIKNAKIWTGLHNGTQSFEYSQLKAYGSSLKVVEASWTSILIWVITRRLNSRVPWLRSLDGLSTHDDTYLSLLLLLRRP